jgi:hypothetical protein
MDSRLVFKPDNRHIDQEKVPSKRVSAQIQHFVECRNWEKKAAERALEHALIIHNYALRQLECDKNGKHSFYFTDSETYRYNHPDGWHNVRCSNCEFSTHVAANFDLNTLNTKK